MLYGGGTLKQSQYVDFAEYYDFDHAISIDVEFYLEFAAQSGSPILELACGTGRLLIPIAKTGFDIHGVDISVRLLALQPEIPPVILQNNYDNTARQLNFSASSLSNFPSGDFTLATVTFNALTQTSSTSPSFNTTSTPISDITFFGSSVLTGVTDGTVVIAASNKLFLPLMPR